MKILFLSHYFSPEGNAPAGRVHALCRRWVAEGHEVTVVTCTPNVPNGIVYPGYNNRWRQVENLDGIQVVRVWTYLAPNKGTFRRTANYLSYMLSSTWHALRLPRPQVVVATSPQFFCGWAGVLVAKLLRVPLVLEIRDIWPESIAAVGAVRNQSILRALEWLEQRLYAAAGQIVTVGEGYRQRLIQKQVPPEKIAVVMNGLDGDVFQPGQNHQSVRQRWGLEGKFVCSYSGTIGMACGLETVLKAAEILRRQSRDDVVFLLIGDGAVREELERKAMKLGLKNVIFTGRQPKVQMPAYIELSDVCLVHLRKTDAFTAVMPSKIFEAAGMKKPIINGVKGFAADFVSRAGAGINIEPEDAVQLADAVCYFQTHSEERLRLGQSGHDFVTANYNCDALARDYLCILGRMWNGG